MKILLTLKILLSHYTPHCYALLRIMAGFLFLWHGAQKLFGYPEPMPPGVPAFITFVAGPIELLGGILIMIGLFTTAAAFISSGLMACAYWIGHGTTALLPIRNKGELAALYCFVFLYIATQGSGIWSIDNVRRFGSLKKGESPCKK